MVLTRVFNSVAKAYQARVFQRMNQFGLKYEDCFNEADPDVVVAIARLSPEVAQERSRRIKRALDISLKKKPLSMEIQNTLEPNVGYMQHLIDDAAAARVERELYEGARMWRWF